MSIKSINIKGTIQSFYDKREKQSMEGLFLRKKEKIQKYLLKFGIYIG